MCVTVLIHELFHFFFRGCNKLEYEDCVITLASSYRIHKLQCWTSVVESTAQGSCIFKNLAKSLIVFDDGERRSVFYTKGVSMFCHLFIFSLNNILSNDDAFEWYTTNIDNEMNAISLITLAKERMLVILFSF